MPGPIVLARRMSSYMVEQHQEMSFSKVFLGHVISLAGVLSLTPDPLLLRAASERAERWAVVFWRAFFYCVCLFVYIGAKNVSQGKGLVQPFLDMGWWGLGAGFVFGLNNLTFTLSVQNTAAANTLVVVAAGPMFSAFFSYVLLREQQRLRTVVAALVCLGAIIFIFVGEMSGGGSRSVVGVVFGAVSSICLGLYFTLLRMAAHHRKGVDMIPCTVLGMALLCVVALGMQPDWDSVGSTAMQLLVAQGVVLFLGFTFLSIGPRYIPAAEVNLFMLLQTIMGPVWVYVGGYEKPPSKTLYGGIVIIAALAVHAILAFRDPHHEEKAVEKGATQGEGKDVENAAL